MTWRRGEAGSTLIDPPKDAPVPDFTNGKERVIGFTDTSILGA